MTDIAKAMAYNADRWSGRTDPAAWLPFPLNTEPVGSACFAKLVLIEQRRLIQMGVLEPTAPNGSPNDDGALGPITEAAFAEVSPMSQRTPMQIRQGDPLPQAHLLPNGRLDGRGSRAHPLAEEIVGYFGDTNIDEPHELASSLIEYLDVEHTQRYRPQDGSTYCNIYATDYVYAWSLLGWGEPPKRTEKIGDRIVFYGGCYLPRVWWYDAALEDILRGKEPHPVYAQTVREMNANSLHNWMYEHGAGFGWTVTQDPDVLQNGVDRFGLGVIIGRRRPNAEGRRYSGHISVVVPQGTNGRHATIVEGLVGVPLQSQAGSTNRALGVGGQWWRERRFDSYVMAFQGV